MEKIKCTTAWLRRGGQNYFDLRGFLSFLSFEFKRVSYCYESLQLQELFFLSNVWLPY